eukprot:c10649_g1_i1 orf=25-189(+)
MRMATLTKLCASLMVKQVMQQCSSAHMQQHLAIEEVEHYLGSASSSSRKEDPPA